MTALADRRDLTAEELHALVGAPLAPGAVMMRRNGDLLETAWEEPLTGARGWAWSLSRGAVLITSGWTSGNRRDRDAEIRRAVEDFHCKENQ